MLKRYFPLLIVTLAFFSCDVKRKDKLSDDAAKLNEQALKDSTSVQIIDSSYNFGEVMDGEKVEYNYRFKNTGGKPLVVVNATASCGCTVPQKPEKPVMPGETGYIKVVFNSKGRVGHAEKHVNVVSNARPDFPALLLTGEVKPAN